MLKSFQDVFGIFHEENVEEEQCDSIQTKMRYFINKKVKYIWDIRTVQFVRLR